MNLFGSNPLPGSIPALFLHIQKTAGTSIVHLARQYYGGDVKSHGDCWGTSPDAVRHLKFISGHLGFDYVRSLMAGRYSFTFLRDPAERILSLYYFCLTRNPAEFDIYKRAHDLDLINFLAAGFSDPCVKMSIWNNQVWQLAHGYFNLDNRTIDDFGMEKLLRLSKLHLTDFSYVGLTETVNNDSKSILKALGLPKTNMLPQINVTPSRPQFEQQPTAIKKLLRRLTELDQELYEYARHELIPLQYPVSVRCWRRT